MRARAPVERLSFRRAPLLAAALCFATGVAVAHAQMARGIVPSVPLLLAGMGGLAALTVAALWKAERVALLPVAALWVALGMAAQSWQPAPLRSVRLAGLADNLSRTVRGQVVRVQELPRPSGDAEADTVAPWEVAEETPSSGERRFSVDLAVNAAEELTPDVSRMVPVEGGVRVTVYGAEGAPSLHCGDEVEVPLRMKLPERYGDPGAFQYADYLAEQGIASHASVAGAKIAVTGARRAGAKCRLQAAQSWAAGRILLFRHSKPNRSLPAFLRMNDADAGMLDAMLFGDRTRLSQSMRVGFERTATFHLFVVSGLHMGLVAGAVFWAGRRLRLSQALATAATLGVTAAYAGLTGFGQPAQRALAMTAVFLLARLMTRTRDPLNALGAAALAMLLWDPAGLFGASFEMTSLVVVAIAGLSLPLAKWTALRFAGVTKQAFREWRRIEDPAEAQCLLMLELWGEELADLLGDRAKKLPARLAAALFAVGELMLLGLVVELVMVLPMALWFHRAVFFGLPANMVVLPVVGLLAGCAVVTFGCAVVSPWLAVVPGAFTAAGLHTIDWAIGHISRLAAADVRIPGPGLPVALLAVAGWGVCCWAVRRSRWWALGAATALPLIAALVLWPVAEARTPGALEVTAIDVGQGDSVLVMNPDGRSMLVDAGGPTGQHGSAETVAKFDVGEEVVAPYLWSRGMRRLDVLVLSHAHTDHMGGMAAVMRDLRPRELWVGVDPHSALYAALLEEAEELGVQVRHLRAGDGMDWGPVKTEVLAPERGYLNAGAPKNSDSVVLRLEYGKSSVLLEGDAERPSEQTMVAMGRVRPVTLLKVGHHGSRTSSTEEFVQAAQPRFAVVSVGKGNTFGHPRGEVIERFAERGTRLARTDEFGLTTYLLRADGGVEERLGTWR